MGKTKPLNDADMVEFVELQKTCADFPKSWSIDVGSLSGVEGYDLSVKNPDGGEVVVHRTPVDIMDEIAALDAESAEVFVVFEGCCLTRKEHSQCQKISAGNNASTIIAAHIAS